MSPALRIPRRRDAPPRVSSIRAGARHFTCGVDCSRGAASIAATLDRVLFVMPLRLGVFESRSSKTKAARGDCGAPTPSTGCSSPPLVMRPSDGRPTPPPPRRFVKRSNRTPPLPARTIASVTRRGGVCVRHAPSDGARRPRLNGCTERRLHCERGRAAVHCTEGRREGKGVLRSGPRKRPSLHGSQGGGDCDYECPCPFETAQWQCDRAR